MKRSLLIIMSLLLACIMALTSCNTAHPEPLPTNDSVDTSIAEENEFLADADVEAEAELELEVVADSESSADSASASAPEANPESNEAPAGEATLGTKDEAITEAQSSRTIVPRLNPTQELCTTRLPQAKAKPAILISL